MAKGNSLRMVVDVPIASIKIRDRHRKELGDISSLAESIEAVGLLQPVVLIDGNKLVAGQRRIAAYKHLKRKEIPAVFARDLSDAFSLLRAERDENTCRKDFAPTEAVALGKALEEIERPQAEERQREAGKERGRGKKGRGKLPQANRTRDRVGSAVGMSGKTYEKAKQVIDAATEDPELAPVVEEMDKTGNVEAAHRKLKESRRQKKREANRQQIESAPTLDAALVAAKFSTIVVDPPWDWGDEGDVDQLGRARPTFETMPLEDLLKFPITDKADSDAHLYLWITNRSLPKGFALLEAWGFRYVTCLTWCKPSIGMGNYFRGSTEQVLFGVRGSMPLLRKDVGTWFAANRPGELHSQKPDEFYSLIETCSPGPYLDVFARRSRQGWTCWGGEL